MKTSPKFLLTHKKEITVLRPTATYRDPVTLKWVEGEYAEITIVGNLQPLRYQEVMLLPESERSKEWIKVFTTSELRNANEGKDAYDGDIILYKNKRFLVRAIREYNMGTLDHFEARAVRFEQSAGENK